MFVSPANVLANVVLFKVHQGSKKAVEDGEGFQMIKIVVGTKYPHKDGNILWSP